MVQDDALLEEGERDRRDEVAGDHGRDLGHGQPPVAAADVGAELEKKEEIKLFHFGNLIMAILLL